MINFVRIRFVNSEYQQNKTICLQCDYINSHQYLIIDCLNNQSLLNYIFSVLYLCYYMLRLTLLVFILCYEWSMFCFVAQIAQAWLRKINLLAMVWFCCSTHFTAWAYSGLVLSSFWFWYHSLKSKFYYDLQSTLPDSKLQK